MSMFNNLPGFDLMGWLNQGRQAGIDFSQLPRMQNNHQEQRPRVNPMAFLQQGDFGQMPSRSPQADPRQPNNSMFSMMDILSAILNNRQRSSVRPTAPSNPQHPEGSIPYERRATDNYEGFYSTPYAPLKEGMTREDLGKITAGNLGASAGFR